MCLWVVLAICVCVIVCDLIHLTTNFRMDLELNVSSTAMWAMFPHGNGNLR